MKKTCLAEQNCPLARGYNAIGDWWSLLIIGQIVLGGARRFNELQCRLGMAKNILTARLKKLVDEGVLEKERCPDGSAYSEYMPTQMGKDLFKVLLAMREWGAKYYGKTCNEKTVLVDRYTLQPVQMVEVHAADGRVLQADDLKMIAAGEVESH